MCRDQSANKVWKQRSFINLLTQANNQTARNHYIVGLATV